MPEYCVSCGHQFTTGETQYETSLYGGSSLQCLCSKCKEFEERQIEQCGKEIPTLLESYATDSYLMPKTVEL